MSNRELLVFYCNNTFDYPQTGGERFYAKILMSLMNRTDVEVILPTESDLHFLNRPDGCLGINRYFFQRFLKLPKRTVILESDNYYYDFFLANWLTRMVRSDLGILVSSLQLLEPLESRIRYRLTRDGGLFLLFRSADAVTVNSSYLGRELMSRYGVQQNRIHIVYSAGQDWGSSAYQSAVNQNGSLHLLCVANIRPLKGQRVLVEALSYLQDDSLELVFVGGAKDEEYERELRTLIVQLGLSDRVRVVGWLEGVDLTRAYAEADICVVPSLYESYGTVVQEAMSFGVPVVASNVGGIPEQITNGVEGILVPPGDPKALAEALHRLIADPALRAQMGDRGRQRTAELPTHKEVFERFYQVLITLGKMR